MSQAVLTARIAANPLVSDFFERAREIEPIDAGHDFSHIERVAKLTLQIFTEELKGLESRAPTSVEQDACIVAALLHDCVPIAKNSPLRKESSRLASEKAREWLDEVNFANESVRADIAGAILDHSFSSGRVPTTLLGRSLQDADRLEALGALGLYRTIATGVSMGTSLFDVNDPWATHRDLNDQKFTIDHFFAKLLKLPDTFRTQAARNEAQRRKKFLEVFLDQLKSEI